MSRTSNGKNITSIIVAIIGLVATVSAAFIGVSGGRQQEANNMKEDLQEKYSIGYEAGQKSAIQDIEQKLTNEYNKGKKDGYDEGYEDAKSIQINPSVSTVDNINTSQGINASNYIYLNKLDWLSLEKHATGDFEYTSNIKISTGDIYENAIIASANSAYYSKGVNTINVEWYLNKKYKSIEGTIAIPYDNRDSRDVYSVYFYSDDNQMEVITDITTGTLPIQFDFSLEDTVKLKIEINRTEYSYGNSAIAIVDTKLFQ